MKILYSIMAFFIFFWDFDRFKIIPYQNTSVCSQDSQSLGNVSQEPNFHISPISPRVISESSTREKQELIYHETNPTAPKKSELTLKQSDKAKDRDCAGFYNHCQINFVGIKMSVALEEGSKHVRGSIIQDWGRVQYYRGACYLLVDKFVHIVNKSLSVQCVKHSQNWVVKIHLLFQ